MLSHEIMKICVWDNDTTNEVLTETRILLIVNYYLLTGTTKSLKKNALAWDNGYKNGVSNINLKRRFKDGLSLILIKSTFFFQFYF